MKRLIHAVLPTAATLCLLAGALYGTVMTTLAFGSQPVLGLAGWGLGLFGLIGVLACLCAAVLQWRTRRPKLTLLATALLFGQLLLLSLCFYISLVAVDASGVLDADYMRETMRGFGSSVPRVTAILALFMSVPLLRNLRHSRSVIKTG